MGNSQNTLQKKELKLYISDKTCVENESLGNFIFFSRTITLFQL